MDPARAPSKPLRERWSALDPLRRALIACAGGMAAAAIALPDLLRPQTTIAGYYFRSDPAWLLAVAAILALAASVPMPAALGAWTRLGRRSGLGAAAVAILVGLAAFGGTFAVFHGVPLSYDEVMADFDARILLGGRLIAPLPPEWRGSVSALAPNFVLHVPGEAGWVSAYLPVNAALRAAFAYAATPLLAGPTLAAIAVLALAVIARRLWPERPDAMLVAVLTLATSAQVLVTAMTPYAMTAHLTLNLVWLALFLRGGRLGHAGAIGVGFLACGLHQMVFHPLFAAPILFGLLVRRRWRLAALYLIAYGLIGAFWALYVPGLLWITGYGVAGAGEGQGAESLFARLTQLLDAFEWQGIDVMAMNLVRFVAWQSPLLLPLACLALPAIRRGAPPMRALAGGIALTVPAMFVLLPFQGHGWGYRYLHGLVGSGCLLAAQGWVDLTRTMEARARAKAAAILGFGWAAAALALMPGLADEAARFARPYVDAAAAIACDPAATVLVDTKALTYGADLVRNDPGLPGGRAVVMLQGLDPARLAALCAKGDVAFFGAAEGARFGVNPTGAARSPLPPDCRVRPVRLP